MALLISILVGAGVIHMGGRSDCGGRPRATEAVVKQVDSQVKLFHLDHGRYPERLEDLVRKPETVAPEDWPRDGYLIEIPTDGWGRVLVYRSPGTEGRAYDLFSLGEDPRDPSARISR